MNRWNPGAIETVADPLADTPAEINTVIERIAALDARRRMGDTPTLEEYRKAHFDPTLRRYSTPFGDVWATPERKRTP